MTLLLALPLLLACTADPVDADGDGFLADQDCDDTDAAVFPGSHSPERPGDGVDQDCDGFDDCRDLDCNGWPDLVLARTQDEDGSYDVDSLVYLGGPDGLSAPSELSAGGAMGVDIADLDGDGYLDVVLAVATTDGEERFVDSLVFAGTADGPQAEATWRLPTIGAADVDAVDVDQDGHVDLVFSDRYAGGGVTEDAYTNPSRIFWGSADGPDPALYTELETIGAARSAIADLDGDGQLDVAFAHGTVFSYDSRIYRGLGGRQFSLWTTLPTVFAEGVSAADADGDGFLDLIYANWCGGQDCDSTVYFGGPAGFSAEDSAALPGLAAVDSLVADLDGDGRQDIVLANSFDAGFDPDVSSYVYWGTAGGWSPAARTSLASPGAGAVAAGDLDLDGFPDLVFAGYYGTDDLPAATAVHHGSAEGFDDASVQWLEAAGGAGVAITPGGRW